MMAGQKTASILVGVHVHKQTYVSEVHVRAGTLLNRSAVSVGVFAVVVAAV